LRFEHDDYITFEREAAVRGSVRLDVALNPAPETPPPPVAAPADPPSKPEPPRPLGESRTVQVPEFAEANFIGRNEPQKLSVIGCTGYSTTRLLQVRDPWNDRSNENADETLYVVAGEATVRLGGVDRQLAPGGLVVVPRGTTHSLMRRGRNPVMLVSVLSGPACENLTR
jgi:mannose-6-phosphate isomerase-like protein (cupin superfamily)